MRPRSETSGKKTCPKAGAEAANSRRTENESRGRTLRVRNGAKLEVGDFGRETVQRPETRSTTSGKDTAGTGVQDLGRRVGANAEVGDFEK